MGWFGDLLEDTGLSDLLTDGSWKTLSNGKRVKLDADGRIVAGLPSKYHGVPIGQLSQLTHGERHLLEINCDDVGHCHTCRKTFRSKDEAFLALMEANPELYKLQQSEFGAYDAAFLKWQRGGRRGPKPRTKITDGRLDSINEFYDLRGAARVGSFTEAIYHAIPSSKRWEDLDERLRPLEEASGTKINPPDEALQATVGERSVEECRAEVDRRLAELFERARAGELERAQPAPAREPGEDVDQVDDQADDAGGEPAPF